MHKEYLTELTGKGFRIILGSLGNVYTTITTFNDVMIMITGTPTGKMFDDKG